MDCGLKMNQSQKDRIWDIIEFETGEAESIVSDLPEDVARRFEEDKEAQYQKLVERLKKEGIW